MLEFQPLLRALCASLLFLSACDEGDVEDPDDNEFRWETNQCVGVGSGSNSLLFGGKSYGPPWDDGDPFAPIETAPESWVKSMHDEFRGQTEAVLVGKFEGDGSLGQCKRTCANAKLTWDDGGGCVHHGDYAFEGLNYASPGWNEAPRFRVLVHAEVEMGCVCADHGG